MSKASAHYSQLHPDEASKALLQASQAGDLQKVKELLRVPGIDCNVKDEDGDTPLMLACLEGFFEIVSVLLENGPRAQLDMRNSEQETPLFIAAGQGHLKAVQVLLDYGLSEKQINTQCDIGMTPLIIAIAEGHSAIASLLISRLSPAQLSIQDNTGMTPLMYAISESNTDIAKMILAAGLDAKQLSIQCEDGWTALMWASMQKMNEVITILLDAALSSERIKLENNRSQTALMIATRNGQVKIVEAFLKKIDSSEIIRANKYGETALLMSARMGDAESMKLFLQNLTEQQVRNFGIPSLVDAIWHGYADIVSLLLSSGIASSDLMFLSKATDLSDCETFQEAMDRRRDQYNAVTEDSYPSPLMYAIMRKDEKIIQLLISKVSSLENIESFIVEEHLLKAIEMGIMSAFEYFLSYMPISELHQEATGSWVDRNEYLMAAIVHNRVEMVRRLLKEGIPAGNYHEHKCCGYHEHEVYSSPALMHAIKQENLEIVTLIVPYLSFEHIGASLKPEADDCCYEYEDDETALTLAAKSGNAKIVQLILNAGITEHHIMHAVDGQKENTVLDMAATYEIKKLIRDRLNLFDAIRSGKTENISKSLIQLKKDVGSAINFGPDPLKIASKIGNSDVVSILLQEGADPLVRIGHTATPLMVAVEYEHIECVKLLLRAGDDVNSSAREQRDRTALLIAVAKRNISIVRLLLQAGAEFRWSNGWGLTAIQMASMNGDLDIVKLLLEAGADASYVSWTQQTALILAAENGHTNVVHLLLQAGADISPKMANGQTALDLAATDEIKKLIEETLKEDREK